MTRQEWNYAKPGAKRTYFYLNGRTLGDVGTDRLDSNVDYAQQLATNRANAANAGNSVIASNATPVTALNGGFGGTYQAYNPVTVDQAGSGYTVMGGDTLSSVAQMVWGDASLWYLLADANGLSATSALVAGQTLRVPNAVSNAHNSSKTFKPYNAADALGNTTPTLPRQPQPMSPKQKGCGVIGEIIATVVSIVVQAVVTFYAGPELGAAAGEYARQGVQIAVGNRKRFDFAAIAAAFVGASIEQALGVGGGGSNPLEKAASNMVRSTIRQGTNMAFGVQKNFDWANLAVAAVSGGVSSKVGNALPASMDQIGKIVVTGTASLLAGAATRTILTRDSFGQSIKAALPDALANTIGDMVSNAIVGALQKGRTADNSKQPTTRPSSGLKVPNQWADSGIDAGQYAYLDGLSFDNPTAAATGPTYFEQQAGLTWSDIPGRSSNSLQSLIGDAGSVELAGYRVNAEVRLYEKNTRLTATWNDENGAQRNREFVAPRGYRLGHDSSSVWTYDPNNPIRESKHIQFSGEDDTSAQGDPIGNADWRVTSFSGAENISWGDFSVSQYNLPSLTNYRSILSDASGPRYRFLGGDRYIETSDATGNHLTRAYTDLELRQRQYFAVQEAGGGGYWGNVFANYTHILGGDDAAVKLAGGIGGSADGFSMSRASLAGGMGRALPFTGATGPRLERTAPTYTYRPNSAPKTTADVAAVNPRLTTRLAKWQDYQARGGPLDMQGWVKATQGQSWGFGGRSGYADWIKSVESTHGNSLLSSRTSQLYELYTKDGDFLKYGVSQNPYSRYSTSFMADKDIFPLTSGTRSEMLTLERQMVTQNPGQLNLEPWAKAARAQGRGQ